jgi:cyclopropane-fatty-acyl-phospholipid synthase
MFWTASASDVAHPLIAPLPTLARPIGARLRPYVLRRLKAQSASGRLDLQLPDGSRLQLGAGDKPVATLRISDDRLFARLALRGEMGAGESFVAGEWDSDDVVAVVRWFLRATSARGFESPVTTLAQFPAWVKHRRAANSQTGSKRNISAHYDVGNDFYQLFLDDTMTYSCGVWRDGATSLADAQRAKFERLCNDLQLTSSDHLVEIGCGWGGMAIHAASTRGCKVTGITVSREQLRMAQQRVQQAGLAHLVDIQFCDYRALKPPASGFTKLVSIEMIEAVGYEFLPAYFAACSGLLASGGIMSLQAITMPDDRFESYRKRVDWMQTYIFPGSLIPSVQAMGSAMSTSGLRLQSQTDIGTDYALTLKNWRESFTAKLAQVKQLGFDQPFVRTWMMYLAFSEAAFAEQTLSVKHMVLRKNH